MRCTYPVPHRERNGPSLRCGEASELFWQGAEIMPNEMQISHDKHQFDGWDEAEWLGFKTGNPRVGISHTVPVPLG